MTIKRLVLSVLLLAATGLLLAGCPKDDQMMSEGSMEDDQMMEESMN